jgi:GNAT superfamily N-acetyltransferase
MNIEFIQIYKENIELYQELLPEWIKYTKELDNEDEDTAVDVIIDDLQRRVDHQGVRRDMYLKLFYIDNTLVGFAHFAVAKGSLYGLLEPENGFVMEFYIIPKYRRKGYGKILYNHIEETLIHDGVGYICLTANQTTGEPFWSVMGFSVTGKIDPDNNLPVLVKKV